MQLLFLIQTNAICLTFLNDLHIFYSFPCFQSLTDGAGPSQIIGSDEPSTVAIVPFSSHHVELDYRVVTPEAGLK